MGQPASYPRQGDVSPDCFQSFSTVVEGSTWWSFALPTRSAHGVSSISLAVLLSPMVALIGQCFGNAVARRFGAALLSGTSFLQVAIIARRSNN